MRPPLPCFLLGLFFLLRPAKQRIWPRENWGIGGVKVLGLSWSGFGKGLRERHWIWNWEKRGREGLRRVLESESERF